MKRLYLISLVLFCFVVAFMFIMTREANQYKSKMLSIERDETDTTESDVLSAAQQLALFEQIKQMPDENMLVSKEGKARRVSDYKPWVQGGPFGFIGGDNNVGEPFYHSGKVTSLALDTDGRLYIGSTGGGLWRLRPDDPTTAEPIADEIASSSIGAVAIHPEHHNTIFIGTGIFDGRPGTGVYRSTNEGQQWSQMHLQDIPDGVSKIVIPSGISSPPVLVASSSGIFRSSNAGEQWQDIWVPVQSGSFSDIAINETGDMALAGREGVGIYYSKDIGESWHIVTDPVIPTTLNIGRISISMCSSDYAFVQIGDTEDRCLGIYRYSVAGNAWTDISPSSEKAVYLQQQRSCNAIIAKYTGSISNSIVWAGGTGLLHSSEGGDSWNIIIGGVGSSPPPPLHTDMHAFLYNGDKLYVGTDGGVFYTTDDGVTWKDELNRYLPLVVFNSIDIHSPSGVKAGGAWDNAIIGTTPDDPETWKLFKGGDGFDAVVDPNDPSVVYGGNNDGPPDHKHAMRWKFINGVGHTIDDAIATAGDNSGTWKEAWFEQPRNSRLYVNGYKYVWYTDDAGENWDHLNSDPFDGLVSHVTVTDNGYSVYVPIHSIEKSNGGSTIPKLYRYDNTDLAGSWEKHELAIPQDKTVKNPPKKTVKKVCVHPYLDFYPYVYAILTKNEILRSSDFGDHWEYTDSKNLPPELTITDLIDVNDRLYLATRSGAFISTNRGDEWIRWNMGMPWDADIRELRYYQKGDGKRYIVAGVCGRSTFLREVDAMDPNFHAPSLYPLGPAPIYYTSMIDSTAVKNTGEATLEVYSTRSDDPALEISPLSATIVPGDSQKFYFTIDLQVKPIGAFNIDVEFLHNAPGSPSHIKLVGYKGDANRFRTFPVESLIEKKGVKPTKRESTRWCFTFDNTDPNREGALELNLEFNKPVVEITSYEPFNQAEKLDTSGKKWKFSGGTVEFGSAARICGVNARTIHQIVNKWWWKGYVETWKDGLEGGKEVILGEVKGKKLPDGELPGLGMPNTANFRQEVMRSLNGSPLVVGIPVDSREAKTNRIAYVSLSREAFVYKSLALTKMGKQHDGPPRYFDRYYTPQGRSTEMVGKFTSLPPDKHSNHLFAELLAFKLNLWGSAAGITPRGFGELRYTGTGRFKDLRLWDIDSLADRYMTYAESSAIGSAHKLDSIIHLINTAFSGPIDTIMFAGGLQFTGVRPIAEVAFLERDASAIPRTIAPPGVASTLPDDFELSQNYPNPFNPTTTIEFSLPQPSVVTLKVYNYLGQEVTTLIDYQQMDDGLQEVEFDASNLATGVYLYRITADVITSTDEEMIDNRTFTCVKKMLLVK